MRSVAKALPVLLLAGTCHAAKVVGGEGAGLLFSWLPQQAAPGSALDGHGALRSRSRRGTGPVHLSLLEERSMSDAIIDAKQANLGDSFLGPGVGHPEATMPVPPSERFQLMSDMGRLETEFEAEKARENALKEKLLDQAAQLQHAQLEAAKAKESKERTENRNRYTEAGGLLAVGFVGFLVGGAFTYSKRTMVKVPEESWSQGASSPAAEVAPMLGVAPEQGSGKEQAPITKHTSLEGPVAQEGTSSDGFPATDDEIQKRIKKTFSALKAAQERADAARMNAAAAKASLSALEAATPDVSVVGDDESEDEVTSVAVATPTSQAAPSSEEVAPTDANEEHEESHVAPQTDGSERSPRAPDAVVLTSAVAATGETVAEEVVSPSSPATPVGSTRAPFKALLAVDVRGNNSPISTAASGSVSDEAVNSDSTVVSSFAGTGEPPMMPDFEESETPRARVSSADASAGVGRCEYFCMAEEEEGHPLDSTSSTLALESGEAQGPSPGELGRHHEVFEMSGGAVNPTDGVDTNTTVSVEEEMTAEDSWWGSLLWREHRGARIGL